MQQYPSILGSAKAPLGKPCIAFNKYDGSNLRWEWSPKTGWNKFGTRHELFDHTTPIYSQAIPLFMNGMADEIVSRIKDFEKGCKRITAFTEFFGPNSFAGKHDENEPKELKLIDVYLFKRGLMKPRDFVKVFSDLPSSAEIIYDGNLNKQFIQDVKEGKYPVVEGVIAKGDDFMIKIKTNTYFKKLNEVYGTEYRNYWE